MTADAYEALKAEIATLETEGRQEKAEKIAIAREFGDLKEDSEYYFAKDDAALLEAKISRLTEQLLRAWPRSSRRPTRAPRRAWARQ